MLKKLDKKLSVAPMMDWTDRHCRVFHRAISREVLLYTEMVTAQAVVHGDAARLLGFSRAEHPVALQLGGSDPALLAQATIIACDFGYDEVNLNIGCPSDRVQSGRFGAVLMKEPVLVAECARAMIEASKVEITVKCRIGVDDQVPAQILPEFLETVAAAGVHHFAIHARKAWLQGLSPKDNRRVPPLDHDLVRRMRAAFPDLSLAINGGIETLDQARGFLDDGFDGAMIGRAAYHDPFGVLGDADRLVFGTGRHPTRQGVANHMRLYIDAHIANGGQLHHITRHMLGLFAGQPGARAWRRYLSENANAKGAGSEVVTQALNAMPDQTATREVADA